jgi:hypothetical protein
LSDTPPEASQTLPQAQILPQIDAENVANTCATFAMLVPTQKSVLLAIMEDFLSENIRTDRQIASDCGVHAKTVYNCKVNPAFNAALAQVMPELVKAKLPMYIGAIEKAGLKDWKALQFLLEFAGLWTKTQRNLNINANIGGNTAQNMSIQDSVDSILIRLGELGWNRTRVLTLADRFDELKAEGAF